MIVRGHRPRYADLCQGGALECVIALGFDEAEGGDSTGRATWLAAALRDRGYTDGAEAAAPLLARRGRSLREDGDSVWLSRDHALVYPAPGGEMRTAAMVVRILSGAGSQG